MALLSFVAGETISANNAVYVSSNGLVYKASALTAPQATVAGIALDSGSVGSLIRVNPDSVSTTFSGFTPGEYQYLSLTSGSITQYPSWITSLAGSSLVGAYLTRVGRAVSSSGLEVEVSNPLFVSASGL